MVNKATEDLLIDFLDRERKSEQEGYTRAAVLKAVDTIGSALQKHQRDCEERWNQNEERHKSAEKRLRTLEAEQRPTPVAAPPSSVHKDDPAEITGAHRIDAIADKVKQATIESLRVPGTDPEAAIRQVVAEEQEALAKRNELKRLQAKEDGERTASEAAAKDRRDRYNLVIAAIAGTVGGAGVLWLIQFLATHVH